MSSPCHVFKTGRHAVKILNVHQEDSQSSVAPPPPKPLLVSTPCEEGEFPVLIFVHGYLLYNSFYSQLLQHISSHGFIVVAPQVTTAMQWLLSCNGYWWQSATAIGGD